MAHLHASSRWTIEIVRTVLILAIVLSIGAVYTARGDNHDTTYYACLYAGSLSQVGTTPPANCGRGTQVQWTSATAAQLPQTITRSTNITIDPESLGFASVECEAGEVVTGGGYTSGGSVNVFVNGPIVSFPFTTATGWRAYGKNESLEFGSSFTVYVLCMALPTP